MSCVGTLEEFSNNLVASGVAGLEHNNSAYLCDKYLSKYMTKTPTASKEWEAASRSVTEEYVTREGNENKTLHSLVARHMSEVTKGLSFPRDYAHFVLGGGKLVRNSAGSPLKCSLTSQTLESIAPPEPTDAATADASNTRFPPFTWKNAKKRYSKRVGNDELELYSWCALHWVPRKTCVVQFFGYHDKPSWPLPESYSKWTLALYKPWRGKPEETLGDHATYASSLEAYLSDPQSCIPRQTWVQIQRAKRNEIGVDLSEGDATTGAPAYTPTEQTERSNTAHTAAAAAADSACAGAHAMGHEDPQDLPDSLFNSLRKEVPLEHCWSGDPCGQYSDLTFSALLKKSEQDTLLERDKTLSGTESELKLFEEHIHNPTNVKSKEQKFLVYHNLYYHYLWDLYEKGLLPEPPPTQLVKIEGLPGVGKTFVIMCLRNIARRIKQSNGADLTSAPTGAASFLINGRTHYRLYSIPTQKKQFKAAPKNLSISNADRVRELHTNAMNAEVVLMDEDSMVGRELLAHIEHRHCELRNLPLILDDDGHALTREPVGTGEISLPTLHPSISNRPWGGFRFIYKFGDVNQLPPVLMKPVYDTRPGMADTSSQCGRVAFKNFIDPPDETQAESTVVIMECVLRQDDEQFKDILDHVRNGTLVRADHHVKFIFNKMLYNMPDHEKELFRHAIHLVPQ